MDCSFRATTLCERVLYPDPPKQCPPCMDLGFKHTHGAGEGFCTKSVLMCPACTGFTPRMSTPRMPAADTGGAQVCHWR